jgi:poly(A) polymerase
MDKLDSYEVEELSPPSILNGHDLIALGYEPGPIFSRILRFVEDAQLEGTVNTKDEALNLVTSNFPLDSEHAD